MQVQFAIDPSTGEFQAFVKGGVSSFPEAKAKLEAFFAQIGKQGAVILLDGEIEQHRHDDHQHVVVRDVSAYR